MNLWKVQVIFTRPHSHVSLIVRISYWNPLIFCFFAFTTIILSNHHVDDRFSIFYNLKFIFSVRRDHLITASQPVPKASYVLPAKCASDHATVSDLLQQHLNCIKNCYLRLKDDEMVYWDLSLFPSFFFYSAALFARSQFPLLILINFNSFLRIFSNHRIAHTRTISALLNFSHLLWHCSLQSPASNYIWLRSHQWAWGVKFLFCCLEIKFYSLGNYRAVIEQ